MTQAVQTAQYGSSSVGLGFKNRIINGAMVISQRNGTSSVTPASQDYSLDRFQAWISASSKFTVQQDAGAVTPPAGFTDYLGVTSTSAYSVTSGDYFAMRQPIEGFNVADLGWGTANAKTVTLSFWVRSSLTGTFGGSIGNSNYSRTYPFTYTVSSANTWTQISVTIAGDTSGTWLTTNGVGMYVTFGLGVGSTYSGTANTWSGSFFIAPTGAVSVVGTNGATFYITGVQFEVGSTATSFDYRPYGTELALCQRYYYQVNPSTNYASYAVGTSFTTTLASVMMSTPTMRSTPSFSYVGALSLFYDASGNLSSLSAIGLSNYATNTATLLLTGSTTAGRVILFATQNSTATALQFSAEL